MFLSSNVTDASGNVSSSRNRVQVAKMCEKRKGDRENSPPLYWMCAQSVDVMPLPTQCLTISMAKINFIALRCEPAITDSVVAILIYSDTRANE